MQGIEAGDLTQTPAANRYEKVFVPSLGGGTGAREQPGRNSNISKINENDTIAGIISVDCNHILE